MMDNATSNPVTVIDKRLIAISSSEHEMDDNRPALAAAGPVSSPSTRGCGILRLHSVEGQYVASNAMVSDR
jgi:hypothetical protein